MVALREKTVSYRRAEWFEQVQNLTLQKCVDRVLHILKTIEARTIIEGGQYTRIVKHSNASGGIYLHLTTETPGEPASVVPKPAKTTEELDLKVEDPPEDAEFLDGDAFLYIHGNHLCMCATGVRDGAIGHALRALIEKADLPKQWARFELAKAADISKLKMLHSQGVKEVEIRGTLYKVTADYEKRKATMVGGLGAIGKHVKHLIGRPHDVTPDGLRVFLTIKTDRRFSKDLDVGEKRIEELAKDVIRNFKEDDEYVIVTKAGQRISPKEIFVRTDVLIEKDGKTVSRDKAWKALHSFFASMENAGVFAQ
jgi:hypothetical protein